jgi:hypothetical protein
LPLFGFIPSARQLLQHPFQPHFLQGCSEEAEVSGVFAGADLPAGLARPVWHACPYDGHVPALIVRRQHSRFQLRRPTTSTTALGVLVLLVAGFLLLFALGEGMNDLRGMPCPAFFGVCLVIVGLRLITGGALLLEAMGGTTYVSALDRPLQSGELESVRIVCRGDEVDVLLALKDSTTSATQGFLKSKDPDGLARHLQAELGVPATVERTTAA